MATKTARTREVCAMLLNAAALALYSYSWLFLLLDDKARRMDELVPESHRKFGPLRFLTLQCLAVQCASTGLHVAAFFVRPLAPLRDAIFTALAYPVGSIVVYSFWAVWHLMGRELIFPAALSEYLPDWLNHSMHTVIVPVNLATGALSHHHYTWWGPILLYAFLLAYSALMITVRVTTGTYVYKYLDTMSTAQVGAYFALTGLVAYALYETGRWIDRKCHPDQQRDDDDGYPVAHGK